jgi:Pectate lyase superfamily protein
MIVTMKRTVLILYLFYVSAFANIVYPDGRGQSPLKADDEAHKLASLDTATGDYWLGQISHSGSKSIYDSSYKVYRNVLDFGAKGDGVHDDTDAIQNAISCGLLVTARRGLY